MASPDDVDALRGRRSVDDALFAIVVGVLLAAAALQLLALATRPPAPTAAGPGAVVEPESPDGSSALT
jgi:hypothetical protein